MSTTVSTDDRISVDYHTYLALLDIRASAREAIDPVHGWSDADAMDWLRARMSACDKPKKR